MLRLHPVPAFADNYIWVLSRGDRAVAVDPGDAAPLLAWLDSSGLSLAGILITHHHPDHVMGLPALTQRFELPVWGPQAEAAGIPGLNRPLCDGDRVRIEALDLELEVLAVPGHTLGHIAYHGPDLLLCGDTLFAAGCGRLFEGTPAQMQASLSRLRELPASTGVYCSHEYTLANMDFALAVEPENAALHQARARAAERRAAGEPTLPSRIGAERRINPFLRWDSPAVIRAARAQGAPNDDPVEVFAALRRWKDRF